MFSFHAVVFVIVLALNAARGQRSVIVEEDDPTLSFTNPFRWQILTNPQTLPNGSVVANYWHGRSGVAVSLPGASVSLVFNGSRVAFYGDLNSDHGPVEVNLDGQKTLVDTFRAAGATPQMKLFERAVDPNQPNHRITVTCLENKSVSFDYFEYTSAVPTSDGTSESPSNTPSASNTQSTSDTPNSPSAPGTPTPEPTSPTGSASTPASSSNGSNTGVVVATVFAGLGWCIVLGLVFLLFRFRRQSQKDDGYTGAVPVSGALSFTSSSSPGMTEARRWPPSGALRADTSYSPDVSSAHTSPTVLSSVPARFSAARGKGGAAAPPDPPAYV